MKILVTGNTGYIGPVLAQYLKNSREDLEIIGYDQGYFAHCLTDPPYLPEFNYDEQYWGDLRDFPFEILDDIDTVVHLAAISNDPMGKQFEKITEQINYQSSINIAKEAKARGVSSFIFAIVKFPPEYVTSDNSVNSLTSDEPPGAGHGVGQCLLP